MNKSNEQGFNYNDYFTKDLEKRISEMSNARMESCLKELETTENWIALLKYMRGRQVYASNVLHTTDPSSQATAPMGSQPGYPSGSTLIARYQGILMALSDIQNAIIQLKNKSDEVNKPQEIEKMEL